MYPLDNIDIWIQAMQESDVAEVLSTDDREEWNALMFEQRSGRLTNLLVNPVDVL